MCAHVGAAALCAAAPAHQEPPTKGPTLLAECASVHAQHAMHADWRGDQTPLYTTFASACSPAAADGCVTVLAVGLRQQTIPSTHTRTHTYTHTCMHTRTRTSSHTNTRTHTKNYTHTHTHAHTRAHAHAYARIHAQMNACVCYVTQTCVMSYMHAQALTKSRGHTNAQAHTAWRAQQN